MYCDLTSHLESSVQYHLLVLTQHTVPRSRTKPPNECNERSPSLSPLPLPSSPSPPDLSSELEDHLTHQSSVVSSLQSTGRHPEIGRRFEFAWGEPVVSLVLRRPSGNTFSPHGEFGCVVGTTNTKNGASVFFTVVCSSMATVP
jgi:hypothetical protein